MKLPVILRSCVLFTVMIFITGVIQATNFYVDASTTSSTQNGTLANPWKTLSQVQSNMSSFNPGDIISFKRGGTYPGTFTISRSGTSGNPLTFNNYGTGNLPIFSGTGSTISSLIYMNNRSYVIIDGINITDPSLSPTDRTVPSKIQRGIYVDGSGAANVIIRNCEISLVGVGAYFVASGNTLEKSTITNMRMVRNTQGGDDDYGANPVVISSPNNNILNNYFKDCYAISYNYGFDGGAVEIYGSGTHNNKVLYNTAINCNGFMEFGSGDGGTSDNNLIAYNKVINCTGLTWINNSGQFTINVNNLQFFNNVIVETNNLFGQSSSTIAMAQTVSTQGIISLKNNIFWLMIGTDVAQNGRFSGGQLIHEDNIYRLGSGSTLNFTAHGSELTTTSAIFTSTTGTEPESWNYMPTTGSPAIDFGQNVGIVKDFAGNPVPTVPNSGILESATGATPLAASATSGAIACNGGTATVTVSATGGTAPYTGTGTFTVNAGTHTYTVTDAAGTVKTATITVTQPPVLNATTTPGVINIFGGSTTVTVTASGGTTPYTYSINGSVFQLLNIFTNILAGNHSVTVKDANGCTVVRTLNITQPGPSALNAASTAGTINCNGGTTTVTVTGTGGVSPYSGTGNFTVSAGTYDYTITDAAGTTATTSITVNQPAAITVTVSAGTITVFGGSTTVSVNATGGTGAYTYKLNSGSYQASNSFANVTAGNHSVTVKDANGCTSVKAFTLTQPASNPMVAASSAGTINCNGGTAVVTVSATGGTAPYTGTGDFTVNAGTYSYTVTDANGNNATTSITVSQPSAITVTVSAGTITVFGGSTTVTVNATGGTGAYTYKLNSGSYQAGNSFANVTAGDHSVTVKDANGCTSVKNFTLTEPANNPLAAASSAGTISCNGGTATVTVSATGGTGPYTGTGNFTVSAGTYSYTVTDANGATATTSATVTQPSAIAVTVSAGTITVFGGSTTVTVNATGGTGAYTYKLNSGSYQAGNSFSNVTAGSHAVTVKDVNGCTSVKNFTLTEPADNPLIVSAAASAITCNGNISTITVSATGGTGPYTGVGLFTGYAGTYNYTVTDATGATATTTITIAQPTIIAVTVTAGTITTYGGTTTVVASATGGSGIYSYSLDGGTYQSGNSFLNVGAGLHSITVKDSRGCTKVKDITITQSGASNFRISLVSKANATCKGSATGSIQVIAFGGSAPYSYQINNGRFSSSPIFKNLRAGIYRVNAKDANGNIVSLVVYIFDGKHRCGLNDEGRMAVNLNAYPNPTADKFSLTITSESEEDVTVEVINLTGTKLFEEKGSVNKTYSFGQRFNPGTYFVRVTQGANVKSLQLVKAK